MTPPIPKRRGRPQAPVPRGVNSVVCKPAGFEEFARVIGQLGLYWLPIKRTP